MINHQRLPVSVGLIQRAVIVLGGLIVLFLWMMYHYHNQQVHDERLDGEAAEHLNIAVIIAENLRQMADRAKAAGGIYSSELDQGGEQLADRLSRILAGDPVFNRLSVFDAEGGVLFASHNSALDALPPAWLERMQNASGSTVNEPVMPLALSLDQKPWPFPNWRLPFLVPLPGNDELGMQTMLIEMTRFCSHFVRRNYVSSCSIAS